MSAIVPSLSQDSGLAGAFSQAAFGSATGVKLEAVMEQLQRQQQAKLEMERKERHFREAHILYAQQLAAQQAIMASRAQGAPLTPDFYSNNSRDRALKGGQGPQAARGPMKTSPDQVHEEDAADEMDRGRGSEGDDDDEMMDGEDGSEEEESEGLEFLRKQSLALQQASVGVPPYPFPVYAASPSAAKKHPLSPTTKVKDEPDNSLTAQQSFNTPNGLNDWSLDDSFKQNGNSSWNEEGEAGRSRGEASRDFAKLYELDNDPKRKEFLDDLFAYMQKRVPEDGPASMLPGRLPLALALGHQQQLARAATLEQLRERLEAGVGAAVLEGPERKMARLAEEQQRLLQQAFQQNLLAMASQVNPANLRMANNTNTREEKRDLSLSISSNGSASITVSVEVNGIIYSGSLYAQRSAAVPTAVTAMFPGQTSTLSPRIPSSSSSSSSKGPDSVELATGGSP
ncbi:AT-rich interactive domain-containing protein 3A-like [Sinocyclocheilus grahami]|uniref:AT-rich interactive domain-containing protein 3A-like n=1 Tax=Sinocyclocheilus grahami TaxID=75366 RepID=UPI0007AD2A8A|nr:PREDICTED: AT-rich interactive domain-containing protein 3A-like [Sinocyclocheilus grahami]